MLFLACVLASAFASSGCDGSTADQGAPQGPATPPSALAADRQTGGGTPAASATPAGSEGAPRDDGAAAQEARLRRFVALVDGLSEQDAAFFSDNLVSNETSFLHVAGELPALPARHEAYVGVGPEQNFSYIALLEPSVAYVVDIRRDNLRLHLLYKAAFELASSRAHFVASLLGRPAPTPPAGGAAASEDIAAVLARATGAPATAESFAVAHAALRGRITSWGLRLPAPELARIEAIHRRFHDAQLGLRFALKEANGRTYPTLAEMLAAGDREGRARGFLATDAAYAVVARMQRDHRIIPMVGDFAGDLALPGLAAAMTENGEKLGTFYVSNVEQYLLEPPVWSRWRRNVAALPRAEGAVFLRAWLDQGRAHPRQEKGHRTASFVTPIDRFEASQAERPHGSWWAIASDGHTEPSPAR